MALLLVLITFPKDRFQLLTEMHFGLFGDEKHLMVVVVVVVMVVVVRCRMQILVVVVVKCS